jgi:hypothetical protein
VKQWVDSKVIAKNNGYPINTLYKLKTRLIAKKQKEQQNLTAIHMTKNGLTSLT